MEWVTDFVFRPAVMESGGCYNDLDPVAFDFYTVLHLAGFTLHITGVCRTEVPATVHCRMVAMINWNVYLITNFAEWVTKIRGIFLGFLVVLGLVWIFLPRSIHTTCMVYSGLDLSWISVESWLIFIEVLA